MADKMIEWEWDVETVSTIETDEYYVDDVVGHDFQASYAECLTTIQRDEPDPGTKRVVVLVRTDYRWGGDNRCWAYLTDDGTLPEYASDADGVDCFKVPRRYHQEVAKAVTAATK